MELSSDRLRDEWCEACAKYKINLPHVLDRPNSYFIIARTVQHHTAVLYRTQTALHPKDSHFTYSGDAEMWVMFS